MRCDNHSLQRALTESQHTLSLPDQNQRVKKALAESLLYPPRLQTRPSWGSVFMASRADRGSFSAFSVEQRDCLSSRWTGSDLALDYLERLVTAQDRIRGCPGQSRSSEQIPQRTVPGVLRPPHGPLGYFQGRSEQIWSKFPLPIGAHVYDFT